MTKTALKHNTHAWGLTEINLYGFNYNIHVGDLFAIVNRMSDVKFIYFYLKIIFKTIIKIILDILKPLINNYVYKYLSTSEITTILTIIDYSNKNSGKYLKEIWDILIYLIDSGQNRVVSDVFNDLRKMYVDEFLITLSHLNWIYYLKWVDLKMMHFKN